MAQGLFELFSYAHLAAGATSAESAPRLHRPYGGSNTNVSTSVEVLL
jgi:hypothetical protein